MVKYDENGNIVVGLLDDTRVLSKTIIERYNYKDIKENFDYLVEILEMNKMYHSMYRDLLDYEITDDLEFKTYINYSDKEYTYDVRAEYVSTTDTSVFTLDKTQYEQYIELCKILLLKVKQSWKQLNEVERFIIKSLEFDNPSSTDEQLQDQLMYCNKKYYQYKKSGFIKLGTQLQIDKALKKMNSTNFEESKITIEDPNDLM